MTEGRLILIVGPSGAGKDSLINYAKSRLAADPGIIFPRRVITRPPDATEDHEPVSPADFATRHFALAWQAHGLSYGIPASIEADLAAGRLVIANVSRAILPEASARYPTLVIEITASPATLRARLQARGRESAADIEERLGREQACEADYVIFNDETLEHAGERLVALIEQASTSFFEKKEAKQL